MLLSLGIALAIPAAFWMLLGAFGRDRRLAVFAPARSTRCRSTWASSVALESGPAAIAVVALAERELRLPTSAADLRLGAGAAFLLWLHPSALAFAMAAAALLALTCRATFPRGIRARARAVASRAALFAVWAVHAALARDGAGQAAHTAPRWLPVHIRVLDLVRFGDVLPGRADELAVLALVSLFAAAAVFGIRGGASAVARPLLAGVALLAYFAAPFDMDKSLDGAARSPSSSCSRSPHPCSPRDASTSALCAAAVLLEVCYGAKLAAAYRAFDREKRSRRSWTRS